MDDIRSHWEVPSIAHFCSLFSTAFDIGDDFDIQDLEEALVSSQSIGGSQLINHLLCQLLSGCLGRTDIATYNMDHFLREFLHENAEKNGITNPLENNIDFNSLSMSSKIETLHQLCESRLVCEDVPDLIANLDADGLRLEPIGSDSIESKYWYFYGTYLYREDMPPKKDKRNMKSKVKVKQKRDKKNKKKRGRPQKTKSGRVIKKKEETESEDSDTEEPVPPKHWHLACSTSEEWENLANKFKGSKHKCEKDLYKVLVEDFVPEIPALEEAREQKIRQQLLLMAPTRLSSRLERKKKEREEQEKLFDQIEADELEQRLEMEAAIRLADESKRLEDESNAREERIRVREDRAARAKLREQKIAFIREGKEIPPELIYESRGTILQNKKEEEPDTDISSAFLEVLRFVKQNDARGIFTSPIKASEAPAYYDIIKAPIDLTKIERKIKRNGYKSREAFLKDFKLMFNNCREYNGKGSELYEVADWLEKLFNKSIKDILHKELFNDKDDADFRGNNGYRKADKRMVVGRLSTKRAASSKAKLKLKDIVEDLKQHETITISESSSASEADVAEVKPNRNLTYMAIPEAKILQPPPLLSKPESKVFGMDKHPVAMQPIHKSVPVTVNPSKIGGENKQIKVLYISESSLPNGMSINDVKSSKKFFKSPRGQVSVVKSDDNFNKVKVIVKPNTSVSNSVTPNILKSHEPQKQRLLSSYLKNQQEFLKNVIAEAGGKSGNVQTSGQSNIIYAIDDKNLANSFPNMASSNVVVSTAQGSAENSANTVLITSSKSSQQRVAIQTVPVSNLSSVSKVGAPVILSAYDKRNYIGMKPFNMNCISQSSTGPTSSNPVVSMSQITNLEQFNVAGMDKSKGLVRQKVVVHERAEINNQFVTDAKVAMLNEFIDFSNNEKKQADKRKNSEILISSVSKLPKVEDSDSGHSSLPWTPSMDEQENVNSKVNRWFDKNKLITGLDNSEIHSPPPTDIELDTDFYRKMEKGLTDPDSGRGTPEMFGVRSIASSSSHPALLRTYVMPTSQMQEDNNLRHITLGQGLPSKPQFLLSTGDDTRHLLPNVPSSVPGLSNAQLALGLSQGQFVTAGNHGQIINSSHGLSLVPQVLQVPNVTLLPQQPNHGSHQKQVYLHPFMLRGALPLQLPAGTPVQFPGVGGAVQQFQNKGLTTQNIFQPRSFHHHHHNLPHPSVINPPMPSSMTRGIHLSQPQQSVINPLMPSFMAKPGILQGVSFSDIQKQATFNSLNQNM